MFQKLILPFDLESRIVESKRPANLGRGRGKNWKMNSKFVGYLRKT